MANSGNAKSVIDNLSICWRGEDPNKCQLSKHFIQMIQGIRSKCIPKGLQDIKVIFLIYSSIEDLKALGVKTHYGGPKLVDVVSIMSPIHSVRLELLFQNGSHFP
jgi:hypothetical protein